MEEMGESRMTCSTPDVIGVAHLPIPMPSPSEAWQAQFVLCMVERGVDADFAWDVVRSGEYDYEDDPRMAADDELSYWDE